MSAAPDLFSCIPNLFRDRKMYQSEFTKFMNTWLEQHPEEKDVRQQGRALWWDKPQDVATQQAYSNARVAQKPYPYQPD